MALSAQEARNILVRILGKSERTADGCLLWMGARSKGYGVIRLGRLEIDRRLERVHRTMWTIQFGEIEPELEISHTCKHRNCVEPTHLLKLTHATIIERGDTGAYHRAIRQCPRGHSYDEENTRYRKDGRRVCRACARERRLKTS